MTHSRAKFRAGTESKSAGGGLVVTHVGDGGHIDEPALERLTDTQRAILEALQRPLRDGGPYASPATNKAIADEVHLSVDAVKGHLRALYARLGLEQLPQNAKRARLAEIGVSGAIDGALPPRPPDPAVAIEPVAAAPAPSRRGRIPAMLSAVALGLVLLGVVVGLLLGHDGGDTIISQAPGADEPGNAGQGRGGKGTLLGDLPGPWSDDGLFAAGPPIPAGYALTPGSAGAAPRAGDGARSAAGLKRAAVKGEREGASAPARQRASNSAPAAAQPATPAPVATPAITTTPARRRRTCTTRRRVSYRPATVTVRRVRIHPHVRRLRQVRYRREVRMVPQSRTIPAGQPHRHPDGTRHTHKRARTETVMVRQVRRVPVVRYVTRVRRHRHVRYVKVTRRQRSVRMVRSCRRA